ncbi:MAG TPA: peptidylprolyl isomerase [Candidatus Xenobia bacterium]
MRRLRRFFRKWSRQIIGVTAVVLLVVMARSSRVHRFLHDPMDDVVANVDGQKITQGELFVALQQRHGTEVLTNLMMEKKVAHDAEKQQVTMDEARYEDDRTRLSKQYADRNILAYEEGLLRTQLLIEAIILKDVPETQKHEFYDRFKDELYSVDLSHILVREDKDAQQVIKELQHGSDFAVVARTFSQDNASRNDGGHLGYMTYGQLKRMFGQDIADQIRGLKTGVVSAPIHSVFGYHVFKVLGTRASYDDLRRTVEDQISQSRQVAEIQRLSYELAGKAQTAMATTLPTSNVFSAPTGKASSGVFTEPKGQGSTGVFAMPTGQASGAVFVEPSGRASGPNLFAVPTSVPKH